jgi:hypothetical protein
VTTREERSRWLVSLLRMAQVEAGRRREKLDLPALIKRAVEYGASAVPRAAVTEFADLVREKPFDEFDPDWMIWTEAANWNLRLSEPLTVGAVLSVLTDMGFAIVPPERKDFGVFCNGVMIADFDNPTFAQQFAQDRPGYEIRDRAGRRLRSGHA